MAHYKDLNKELVEQVQTMRISLQEHREEIINLRRRLVAEHEETVHLRKKCNDLALLHCRQYLEILDSDSDILRLLPSRTQELTPKTAAQNEVLNEINANSGRQSARLTYECRRSSSLTQTRRSFNSISPIRSAGCIDMVEDNDDDVEEIDIDSVSSMVNNAIAEEDEEDDQIESEQDDKEKDTTESTRKSGSADTSNSTIRQSDVYEVESITVANDINTVQHRMRTLRDISNTMSKTNNTSQLKSSKELTNHNTDNKKGGRNIDVALKSKKTKNKENENKPILNNKTVQVKGINHETTGRGKCSGQNQINKRSKAVEKKVDNRTNAIDSHANNDAETEAVKVVVSNSISKLNSSSEDSTEEESIQEPRQMQHKAESLCVPGAVVTMQNRLQVTSCTLSDISFSQFEEATSSTPRQHERSTGPTSTPGHSSRPKRSCRPKSLREPSILKKLRNETSEKSLTSNSKRKISHT